MLVPRALDPVEAGKLLPLPPPKPPAEAAVADKGHTGKLSDALKGERKVPLLSRRRRGNDRRRQAAATRRGDV